MRISDWSSDVCSSDLGMAAASFPLGAICGAADGLTGAWTAGPIATFALLLSLLIMALAAYDAHQQAQQKEARIRREQEERSEEHTSELQSLMRISYAVFCLKKKTTKNNQKILE